MPNGTTFTAQELSAIASFRGSSRQILAQLILDERIAQGLVIGGIGERVAYFNTILASVKEFHNGR